MTSKEDDLLSELRIPTSQRDGASAPPSFLFWAGIVAILLVILGGSYFALREPTLKVNAAIAQPLPDVSRNEAVLEASGYVSARRMATVSSKISGKLIDVRIEEGDFVKAGDVLARLEDSDEKAQWQLADAQTAQVQAQLAEIESQLQQSQRDLKRQVELGARGLTSTQAVENARTQVAMLEGSLQSRRAMVTVAAAQMNIAKINYDNTVIRAPFSGVVVAKSAQPGEILSPISAGGGFTRTGICTLVDMDSLEIEVDINEAYIHRVTPKQPVEARLDAYPQWKIPAEVIAIVPTADRSKATVKVRIALNVKDARIVPDMGIRVAFFETVSPAEPVVRKGVLIPVTALTQSSEGSIVFVIQNEKAQKRRVTAGQMFGDMREVETGLSVGERVVREPPASLRDGMNVNDK